MGEERKVENHGGEVAKGVYRITPETTGTGRFLESIPAGDVPIYLVIDYKDGKLTDQIQAAMDDFGGVQTVVAVDTGGDALYRTSVDDQTKATPDQDLASLKAMSKLQGVKIYSLELAVGVDSPPYAGEVLAAAGAQFFKFDEKQKEQILKIYTKWEMDGSNPNRYGKTPFAWQAALHDKVGKVKLPLPEHLVNDPRNPWNPIVMITHKMAGCYVMDLHKHLAAIQSETKKSVYHLPTDYKDRTPGSLKDKGALGKGGTLTR